MRVVRAAGQNVSPSDDGRLYDHIFTDGLFNDTTFTLLGGNLVQIGAVYGDLCGRDFTIEPMTLEVILPDTDGESTGYIYVNFDTSSSNVITLESVLAPFTPTYEDINTNGVICQMILAQYTATSLSVQSVTPKYNIVFAGTVLPGSVATFEKETATKRHTAGDFIIFNGQFYRVRTTIAIGETLVPGTNITVTNVGAQLTSLNNDLNNLIRSSTANVTTNTSGAVVGGPETFGMPAGAVLLAAYFNRGTYGLTRQVNVMMYGASGYRMDFYDGSTAVASKTVSLTCYYFKP